MSDIPPAVGPEQLTMPLFAEELAISRRRVDTVVRVSRKTITSERRIEEDLARDEVVVERVPIGRTVEGVPPVREEGDTIVFPVVEEEVVVTRRLVLREEVRVSRTRTVGRHVETVELRKQQAVVTRTAADDQANITQPAITRNLTMTEETIVAAFETEAEAEAAIADLRAANIPETSITRHAAGATGTAPVAGYSPSQPVEERGFWSSLFGGEPDHDTAVYDHSIAAGAVVVTVKTTEAAYEHVVEILERHEPIDMEERAAGYGLAARPMTGTLHETGHETGYQAGSQAAPMATTGTLHGTAAMPGMHDGADTLHLSAEQLSVGKRVVNRGGTRIRRFVVETPVEEQVTLHDEKVTVERRPVTDGRPVTGDFSERTIEMTESTEEAVVSKTARVVEEVALRKQATDRVETVRDTVRREEVEIETVPAGAATTAPLDPLRAPKI